MSLFPFVLILGEDLRKIIVVVAVVLAVIMTIRMPGIIQDAFKITQTSAKSIEQRQDTPVSTNSSSSPQITTSKDSANTSSQQPAQNQASVTEKIAFVSTKEGNQKDIYVQIAPGQFKRITQLGYIKDKGAQLQWSPDGTKILFVSSALVGVDQLYVVTVDNGDVKRLTFDTSIKECISWSPDGKKILYTAVREGPIWEIHTIDPDGKNDKNLTPLTNSRNPSWSFDGNQIAFASDRRDSINGMRNREIYTMDKNGESQAKITKFLTEALEQHRAFQVAWDNEQHMAWSMDGYKIAFSLFTDSYKSDIYLLDLTAKTDRFNVTAQVETGNNDKYIMGWSPDGSQILYLSVTRPDKKTALHKITSIGSEDKTIAINLAEDAHVSWSTRGNKIAYISNQLNYSKIYVCDFNGVGTTRLTNFADDVSETDVALWQRK
jgi:Tol biopolymer transport system component